MTLIAQLVPSRGQVSGGAWKNHGQYVSSVAKVAMEFLADGLEPHRKRWTQLSSGAAKSHCGK